MHRWLDASRGPVAGAGRRARVAAVAGVALVAVACGGGEEPPEPARPIQAGPTTTGPGAAASPQTLAPGPLAPGSYTTGTFRPKLSFRVGEDWGLLGEQENGFALAMKFDPTANPDRQLTFTAVKWVFDEPLLTDRELDADREGHIRPAPRDLVGWLRANPYLDISTPRPVRLGGLRAVQYDVAVKEIRGPSNCQQFEPEHCVVLFPVTRGAGEPIDLVEVSGSPSRHTLVEVRGQPVLVTAGAPPDQFQAFLAEADKVLATVSFG